MTWPRSCTIKKDAFGKGQTTIRRRDGRPLPRWGNLSALDVETIQRIYADEFAKRGQPGDNGGNGDNGDNGGNGDNGDNGGQVKKPTKPSKELFFHDGRWRARLNWKKRFEGRIERGSGKAAPHFTESSGNFWIDNEGDWEVMVKVLEGESALEVFAAGVTETEWVLEIFETKTKKQVYRGHHPPGKASELRTTFFD